jgi:hypothetical protein
MQTSISDAAQASEKGLSPGPPDSYLQHRTPSFGFVFAMFTNSDSVAGQDQPRVLQGCTVGKPLQRTRLAWWVPAARPQPAIPRGENAVEPSQVQRIELSGGQGELCATG